MPRRTATMLASTLMLIALLCAGVFIPVPYSEMSPGPTVNTLGDHDGEPVLQISGHKTYEASGHLNMTTVRVTSAEYKMNLVEAVYGWLSHDNSVVPHDTLYPDGKTEEQATQENAEEFSASQETAKVAALKALDIPVKSWVVVSAVVKGSPAQGRLHAGDVVKAVDGTAVKKPADVAELVTKHKPGEETVFTIVPAKEQAAAKKEGRTATKTQEVTITTEASDDVGEKRAIVGISAGTDHTFPFEIDIKLADVGGPSAGLMFALGIYDKLTPGDLTGGKFVAGTGTIDDDGKVGPIGGIGMKTIGAHDKGAQYFLTPEDNCAAAAEDTPDGLTLVKVGTIDDALGALKDIRAGKTADLPKCTKG
ncbi:MULTISPECIES: YlbL family protein [Streptomyces]|uniref:YlbL family protein n=1 Tax=Streptomyces TaxID=1883 RepID=UPI0004BDAB5A|nr:MULTISPECIES: PDZ domain-containing protein [Streptomyces]NEB62409.1 PDZ domain-containing protein [Streptomyces diastaticus]KOU06715.1 PDZ/DHR/GLGF domain-containing protein [Streptomyces sp. NRRL F-4711]KOX39345.1 PDZ/DHR/GLGF domain-containing protein [Streptomyces sp. NRRL F-4707]KOX52921.1 PDZ/DHR/GLGF domain-containing protein [Streptomyces sp. NRRL F-7442]MCL7365200.1 PDZ domain-containing protein [Streptomyces ardesiacus]